MRVEGGAKFDGDGVVRPTAVLVPPCATRSFTQPILSEPRMAGASPARPNKDCKAPDTLRSSHKESGNAS